MDDALDPSLRDSAVLDIPVVASKSNLPYLDTLGQREILEELQLKLLMYRLTNLRVVRESPFD